MALAGAGEGRRDAVVYETGRSTRPRSRRRAASACSRSSSRSTAGRCRRFGCDGVVMSTPTGSTAYSFSAGGPVVWPAVEAIAGGAAVAHALFARPLVVGPELAARRSSCSSDADGGILWCDGRRSHDLPPARASSCAGRRSPVRLARLHPAPFTDRLVHKFRLPVAGWRGPRGHAGRDRRDRRDAPARPGRHRRGDAAARRRIHRDHRRDRCGQDDGRDGARAPARGARRLRRRAARARAGVGRGRLARPETGAVAERVRDAGGDVEPSSATARPSSSQPVRVGRGPRRAPSSAAAARRSGCSTELGERAGRRARAVRPAAAAFGRRPARSARPVRRGQLQALARRIEQVFTAGATTTASSRSSRGPDRARARSRRPPRRHGRDRGRRAAAAGRTTSSPSARSAWPILEELRLAAAGGPRRAARHGEVSDGVDTLASASGAARSSSASPCTTTRSPSWSTGLADRGLPASPTSPRSSRSYLADLDDRRRARAGGRPGAPGRT